jgi:hypothetical protein
MFGKHKSPRPLTHLALDVLSTLLKPYSTSFTIVPRRPTHGYMPCPSSTNTWVFISIKQAIDQLLLGNSALSALLCLKDCNQGRSSSLYLGIRSSRPLGLIATLYVITPTTSLLLSLNRLYGDSLRDHTKAIWHHCKLCIHLHPTSTGKFLDRFDEVWCAGTMICVREEFTVTWNFQRPQMGAFN